MVNLIFVTFFFAELWTEEKTPAWPSSLLPPFLSSSVFFFQYRVSDVFEVRIYLTNFVFEVNFHSVLFSIVKVLQVEIILDRVSNCNFGPL